MSTTSKPKHIGRNISRIRELKGMKQEALAIAIGLSQQTISTIEASETVDQERLIEIAKALGVTVEAIENFSEEAVFN
ncbi:helix-turn-helix transcriptional regulator, partial [Flavobacterium sp. HTF]|uniref:helix-turn-helix transcriptional regulator n=1 Tax=Flavobacterium sp. HTF TaxID=2170732 RepID=UPI000D5EE865